MPDSRRVALAGSAARHAAEAEDAGSLGAADRVAVTVVVRRRQLARDHPVRVKVRHNEGSLPRQREPLTARERGVLHGATDPDMAAVVDFAGRYGLDVTHAPGNLNVVGLAGSSRAIGRAFGIDLRRFEGPRGAYRTHAGPVHLPAPLAPVIDSVLGLDATPMARRAAQPPPLEFHLQSVADVTRAYRFPPGTGRGRRIALLEFGGGYHAADLRSFLTKAGLDAAPRVRARSILGVRNAPLTRKAFAAAIAKQSPTVLPTVEATMDVELVAAVAPEATIDVYFAPGCAHGFHAGILAALGLHPPAPRRRPDVIALSWGASEAEWTEQSLRAIDRALAMARDLGVTVCCASGDQGSRGTDLPARLPRVDFPASSPFALACGGTSLRLTDRCAIADETAWNVGVMASGGGASGFFERPSWQDAQPIGGGPGVWVGPGRDAGFAGRGVPDVAASADPRTGYPILVGGHVMPGGGTSAVAPLWAGLLALLSERLDRPVGWINQLIYQPDFRDAFHDITEGHNGLAGAGVGSFRSGPGWDACTGLGSPRGDRLLAALAGRS